MIYDFLIGGVILSPLVPELAISILVTALLSFLLMRLGFYRLVWHRPLVELALFCMILGGIAALTPDGTPVFGTSPHAGNQR